MAKPIISNISIFDANKDYKFTFSYNGNQPHANHLVIMDTVSNEIIKDETTETMRLEHLLPAHTLKNGNSYTAQISVIDSSKNESALSEKLFFTCYADPIFEFENLSKTGQNDIEAANYEVKIHYEQAEKQSLKTYRFYLYDATGMHVISDSGTQYDTDDEITNVYKSLENDTSYYIRCTGETVNGFIVDTKNILLHTSYSTANAYTNITLTNYPHGGYNQISTNIVAITGYSDGDAALRDGTVTITEGCIKYPEGYVINNDNTWVLKIKNPVDNTKIACQSNGTHTIDLYYHTYEEHGYFKLTVDNGISKYVLYSKRIQLEPDEFVTLYIKRQNNLYQLDLVRNP